VGDWLRTWRKVERASPQKEAGRWAALSIKVIPFSRIQLVISVTPFCWGVALVLTGNTMFLQEFLPLLGHVLSTLFISESLDGPSSLVLSKGLELFKCSKGLILSLQEADKAIMSGIINEGDPILVSRGGSNRGRTMEIRVDKFWGLEWQEVAILGKGVSVLLSKDAWLTEGGKRSRVVNFKASDKVLSNKFSQSIMTNVA
jgi:hypothetical protein